MHSFLINLLTLLALLHFSGCGMDSDDDDSSIQRQQEQQEDEGIYQVILSPLNSSANDAKGEGIITISGDLFNVRVNMEGLPNSVPHQQFIHTGFTCPTVANDTNRDGLIDQDELILVTGPALIPLDQDLSSQEGGPQFPVSSSSGSYNYQQSASLDDLVTDLRLPDTNDEDNLVRLPPDQRLNLSGKVLVVHGVSNSPSLPVACGIIQRDGNIVGDNGAPFDEFSTRLNNHLLIAGEKCQGGETIEVRTSNGVQTLRCEKNQFLLTVDNVNTCSPEGVCTEIGVIPLIVDLIRARVVSPTTISFWNIHPDSPTNTTIRNIMRAHWVKHDQNLGSEVVPRD